MDGREILAAQMELKNVAVALILAFLFGGLGLLYVSIPLGIIVVLVSVGVAVVGFLTFGIGALLFIPLHIFCIVAAVVLANRHNARVLARLNG